MDIVSAAGKLKSNPDLMRTLQAGRRPGKGRTLFQKFPKIENPFAYKGNVGCQNARFFSQWLAAKISNQHLKILIMAGWTCWTYGNVMAQTQ